MQLPKLTLVTPKIQSGDLFPALELVMSSKALSKAIASGSMWANSSWQGLAKVVFRIGSTSVQGRAGT